MPVLTGRASLTLYLEEGGLVLASVGEDHTDTPTRVGLELLLLTWDMVIHTMVGGMFHSTDTHICIHELPSCRDKD